MRLVPLPFGEVSFVAVVHDVGGVALFVTTVVRVEGVVEFKPAVAQLMGYCNGFVNVFYFTGEDVTELSATWHKAGEVAVVNINVTGCFEEE
ncbi:MAG TPA: hypothetical protein VD884_18290 [Ohtaekwangia sp.]|nr:hypothetical protein [Ohtaekwangia sp.]